MFYEIIIQLQQQREGEWSSWKSPAVLIEQGKETESLLNSARSSLLILVPLNFVNGHLYSVTLLDIIRQNCFTNLFGQARETPPSPLSSLSCIYMCFFTRYHWTRTSAANVCAAHKVGPLTFTAATEHLLTTKTFDEKEPKVIFL